MTNRRSFLSAGGALAALSATGQADDNHQTAQEMYVHGMVWNKQLPAPMGDWLVRFDAKFQLPKPGVSTLNPGSATLGDDFHAIGSHVAIHTVDLKGDQLTVTGAITESQNASLVGQSVKIQGKVLGNSLQGLTITIGSNTFGGAGLLVVIAIIAILISL